MAADNSLVKRAHQKENYTNTQVEELFKCMDPKIGYLHFLKNYFYIQHPVKGKLLFSPFEFQERSTVMSSSERTQFPFGNCS